LRGDISYQERRIVEVSLKEKADLLDDSIRELGAKSGRLNGKLSTTDLRKLKAYTEKLTRLTTLQHDMNQPDHVPPFFLYHLHFSEVFEGKGGFDVVVANPPYVRGELLGDQKPELQATYPAVYKGTADLYVYFFARAYDLLRSDGQLAFITSNKYLRASYGKGLRKFLSENVRLNALIDFGDLPVFDAAAYPCIVLADKQVEPSNQIPAASIRQMDDLEDLYGAVERGVTLKQAELGESEWQIASVDVQRVFAKLKAAGTPLREYVGGKIYYGIKTGFNEAFVIDGAKRAELIAADPRSAEVIKPWLRGRDVKRWRVQSADLYLIAIQNSGDADSKNSWADAKTEPQARATFRQTYPAIHDHLSQYEIALIQRQDKGRWWWELRACAYYSEFEQPKIVYPDIAADLRFSLDETGFYFGNTAYMVVSGDEFLLSCLNSTPTKFVYDGMSAQIQGGYYRFFSQYIERLPIPTPPDALREQIAILARQCLTVAKSAPESLPALESQLNALVYQAYGLDADDIRVIESAVGGAAAASDGDVLDNEDGE